MKKVLLAAIASIAMTLYAGISIMNMVPPVVPPPSFMAIGAIVLFWGFNQFPYFKSNGHEEKFHMKKVFLWAIFPIFLIPIMFLVVLVAKLFGK